MTATSTPLAGTTAGRTRLPGPDVVRAVALIGVVVMNYNGYLLLQQEDPRSTDALENVSTSRLTRSRSAWRVTAQNP